MNATRVRLLFAPLAAATALLLAQATLAGAPGPIVAGEHGMGDGAVLTVPFQTGENHWVVGDPNNPIPLFADPSAPPMHKYFQSPPTLIQPGMGYPVWENFYVWPGDDGTGFPRPSPAITDWHEHIHEPGWIWKEPPTGESLITRDGEPWPWWPLPGPNPNDPNPAWLWVGFDPIEPGHILDIHKELVWEGVPPDPSNNFPGNSRWGDHVLDDGTAYPEEFIRVWEYPTIPEPSTLVLGAMLSVGFLAIRRFR